VITQARKATAVTRANRTFLWTIGMLVVSSVAIYLSFSYFRASEKWVAHTLEVRAALGDLESALGSAGRARVAFIISGSPDDLNAYRASRSQIMARLQHLHLLVQDNPVQVANWVRMEALTHTRLQAWESAIQEREDGKPVDYARLMQENVHFASDSAAITGSIREEEEHLLQERRHVTQRRFLLAVMTVVASLALALLLLYLYYRGLAKELRAREEAEEAARSGYERQSALRRELERFRVFVNAVKDYAIYVLDSQGHIASWNLGAERINGYSALEILGKHFSCFFTPEDIGEGKPLQEMQIAAQQGQFQGEAWRVRKDGSRFWASVVLTAIKNDRGEIIGFTKVTRDFTERMRSQEALQQANANLAAEICERQATESRLFNSEQSLRELSHHLLRTQDEERRRIGRELHDSLGQYLAMLKMNLDSLGQSLTANGAGREGLKEKLIHSIRLAEDSIKEVRTISHLLYPPLLEEVGLKSAIPWYLEEFSKRSNIQSSFDLDPDFGRLTSDAELALFRVLQESLTNVHRHSGSPTVEVRLFRQDDTAILRVKDRGKGMPSSRLEETGNPRRIYSGVGLRGMSERMRQLGGTLEIKTDKSGTEITATAPTAESMPISLTGT